VLYIEQESVEFLEEKNELLAEKYSFISYQRYDELKPPILIIGR
jgi:hypothetical protein